MSQDLYELLEINPRATESEIKRAYRELARRYHPDGNPGDNEAEEKFKEISHAYEILSDPERRRRYDQFGDTGSRGAPSGSDAFGFGGLFDAFFSGDQFSGRATSRGSDLEITTELSLEEAAFGYTHTVEARIPSECESCTGSGCAPGTFPEACPDCSGQGQVRQVRRSILGQMVTAVACDRCSGTGQQIPSPCPECRGEGRVMAEQNLDVEIPAGIDNGQQLRLPNRGAAAPRGGPPGDLYVSIRVTPHPDFERRGNDLWHRHSISVTQAVLGAKITVPTLDGVQELELSSGTQPDAVKRIKGQGVPRLGGSGRGDLMVQIEIEIPTRFDEEQAALWYHLAKIRGEEVAEPSTSVMARLRSVFR